ncbi:16557_t:CDS:10 [Racocetra persica]|uniref:16557_t:CDS:1 n=1 Tax=Racocetra persica TaxID=160502 RepID=A0ACA9MBX5_9GLOM|nr:16557_t:CDS:10 [Racocetra persica]
MIKKINLVNRKNDFYNIAYNVDSDIIDIDSDNNKVMIKKYRTHGIIISIINERLYLDNAGHIQLIIGPDTIQVWHDKIGLANEKLKVKARDFLLDLTTKQAQQYSLIKLILNESIDGKNCNLHLPRRYKWNMKSKKMTELEFAITGPRNQDCWVFIGILRDNVYYDMNSGWLFTGTKSIPLLYDNKLNGFVQSLFKKPCFEHRKPTQVDQLDVKPLDVKPQLTQIPKHSLWTLEVVFFGLMEDGINLVIGKQIYQILRNALIRAEMICDYETLEKSLGSFIANRDIIDKWSNENKVYQQKLNDCYNNDDDDENGISLNDKSSDIGTRDISAGSSDSESSNENLPSINANYYDDMLSLSRSNSQLPILIDQNPTTNLDMSEQFEEISKRLKNRMGSKDRNKDKEFENRFKAMELNVNTILSKLNDYINQELMCSQNRFSIKPQVEFQVENWKLSLSHILLSSHQTTLWNFHKVWQKLRQAFPKVKSSELLDGTDITQSILTESQNVMEDILF